jgi:hypothetical protein
MRCSYFNMMVYLLDNKTALIDGGIKEEEALLLGSIPILEHPRERGWHYMNRAGIREYATAIGPRFLIDTSCWKHAIRSVSRDW